MLVKHVPLLPVTQFHCPNSTWMCFLFHQIFDVPEDSQVNEEPKEENDNKPPIPPPKKKILSTSENSQNCVDGKPPSSAKAYPAPPRPNRPAPAPRPKKHTPSTGT